MAKKKKRRYYVYQTGGGDPIIDFNLPKLDPNAPLNPDEAPVDYDAEKEKFRQMYNDLFMTPEQKNAARMRELESRGLIDRPTTEQDEYDMFGQGDPTLQQSNKRLGLFDPRRTELHPFIRGLNTLTDIATGIGSKINNVKAAKQEQKEYLEAIAPESYENMERYGLNELPVFMKNGGKNFKSAAAYKKWLAYGHASGEFEKTPGHTKVSIKGKNKKVKHQTGGATRAEDILLHPKYNKWLNKDQAIGAYTGNKDAFAQDKQMYDEVSYIDSLNDAIAAGKVSPDRARLFNPQLTDYLNIFSQRKDLGTTPEERVKAFYTIKSNNPTVEQIKERIKAYNPVALFGNRPDPTISFQLGGQAPQADQYAHDMDDAFYGANATLAHYKGILNEKLKAKNPQAFNDYFKGLVDLRRSGKSEDALKYVQDTPYNDYLSPQEVQETLGGDYDDYLKNLERVNNYNVRQGRQPLYGGVEGKSEDLKSLNYGRRFASLQVTPTYSSSNTSGTSRYTRQYTYDPTLRQINIKEEGDLSRRPSTMSQNQAVALAANFQFGGESIPKTKGLPFNVDDLANVEAERGEAYMDFTGDVYQVAADAKTHEQGGEMLPQVHKVLENTSSLRKDRNSKYLKVDPKQFKAITGVNTTKSMSHAEALVKANEVLDKQREHIVKKIELAGKDKDDVDKLAENSIKLNMDHFAAIPTKQEMFDRLFNHQEAVKIAANIPTGEAAKMGGYYSPKPKKRYQVGGFTPYAGNRTGLKTPAGNYDAFPANLTMDQYLKDLQARGFKYEGITDNKQLQQAIYEYTLQNDPDRVKKMWQEGMHQKGMQSAQQLGFVDDKGRFKPGVLDNPENLRKLGELYPDGDLGIRTLQLAAPAPKKPRVWTDTPPSGPAAPQQKLDTGIKANIKRGQQVQSKFFEPLRWYDTASPINAYLASLERIPEKFNPMEFNQLRYKLADPTAALQQNQGDFNAAVQAVQNTTGAGAGVQFANIANLATRKYGMNNQVVGNFENQNAQIKNQEILYNTQVRDKQSAADQQAREVFEDKVLTSKAKQQEQKLTALDSLYKTIAENRALNRNGNLIMKMSRAFDQYGNYNGYQTQFGVNPTLGMGAPTPTSGKFQPAGGIQGLTPGKNYYNRRTGKTLYFDGINLQER